MAYCYNFKLMFFFYAMISSKHLVASASSSTSESTTMTTSVSLQSTQSLTSETETSTSSTSSPITGTSTHDETLISTSTSVTTTVTSTSVSITSSPSVSTTISSSSSSEPTAASTSETTEPSSSTIPTTIATSTPVPTTPSSSAAMSDNTETSDTTAFSSSTSLTATSSSTYDSTTLSMSASTERTASSTFEATTTSLPSSLQTTATLTSESTTSSQSASTTTAASSTSETTKPSSPSSLTTTSTSMSDSTTLSLSASTTRTTSSTSGTTTMSSPVSEITTPLPTTSPETTAASTLKSTTLTTPPNSIVVDLGSHTLGLNFSIRIKLSFFDEYKIKTSPGFANLSANLTEQLTSIYKNTPGFKYIQIYEINGSRNIRYGDISADEIQLLVMSNELVDANYSVIVSAATILDDIITYINASVIDQLKNLSILGGDVNYTYMRMLLELESLKTLSVCQYSTPKPCPYGYNCMNWTSGSVLCSDRCDRHVCVHGTCYIDHQNEIVTKCSCPIDDDGYVYSGARCEHKSLSTLIIITSAVGGAVLIAAFVIICLICIKLRRNREQLDNSPLDNLPNYSKYFPRNSAFQPHYGYDLPMGSRHIIESRDLEATPSYIPDNNDGQDNTGFFYQENDNPSGDYVSDPIRDKHTYDYIGLDSKFSIRRPQLR